jgi:nucleoside-diphosphate-sugar epimerase
MDFGTDQLIVTGASGWLGCRLVDGILNGLPDDDRLRQPNTALRVRCLVASGQDKRALEALSTRVEVVEGDLREPADCARLCHGHHGAILLHTAGVIHPRRVADFYRVNVDGTRNLLTAALSEGVRRVVVVSSNSPCGCNPSRTHRFDESSPYRPYLNYGRSKMRMELAVKEAQRSGRIETAIVRPPWFYGPNQPPRQALFFRMIREGKAPIVGDGNNLRSMVYIDNLVQGLLLAASSPRAVDGIYWIADQRPYTMNEVIDTVERLLETEFSIPCAHRRLRLPSIASEAAWLADQVIQGIGLYHQKIHVLSEMNKTIACSIDRAQAELGYRPTIELEEGMRRSIRWMLQQNAHAFS